MNPQLLFALAANAPSAPDWWHALVTQDKLTAARAALTPDAGVAAQCEVEIKARLTSEAEWAWNRAAAILSHAPIDFSASPLLVPDARVNGGLRRVP